MQDLWQSHYQVLSIILQKDFIKFNVNTDMMIKKCKTYRLKYKDCDCCLEYTKFKDDLIECKCLCCHKNYQKKFNENLKDRLMQI